MARKLLAVLVVGAVVFAGIAPALSAPSGSVEPGKPVAAAGVAKAERNQAPLPAGRAAGITPAQGQSERVWNIIGVSFIVGVGAAMAFVHGGDDNNNVVPVTTSR